MWKAVVFLVAAAPATAQTRNALSDVAQVYARLNALTSVKADQTVELNYASEGYHRVIASQGRLDFDASVPLGARFRFESPQVVYGSDGTGTFLYDKVANTLDSASHPTSDRLSGAFLSGSLYALRRGLAALAASDSATVTRPPAATPGTFRLSVRVRGLALGADGEISRIQPGFRSTYILDVDETSGVPRTVTRLLDNGDFARMTFANLQTSLPPVPPGFWSFADLVNADTRPPQSGPSTPLVELGAAAPSWTLPVYGSSRRTTLAALRGRPALLVFWTAHCGYSIAAMPVLRAFQRAHPRIQTVLVNVNDTPETIRLFVRNNRPPGRIVWNAHEVSKAYGIPGFPTAIVVDARGTVVYAGDVNADALSAAVAAPRTHR